MAVKKKTLVGADNGLSAACCYVDEAGAHVCLDGNTKDNPNGGWDFAVSVRTDGVIQLQVLIDGQHRFFDVKKLLMSGAFVGQGQTDPLPLPVGS